ncbi:MAG: outer membrane protein assembly factor BamD [Candidatus Latescibacteria bacterium]|nr:outer membrane protein assembly factor BamD [Candidatus Latescibacterota bacterium]
MRRAGVALALVAVAGCVGGMPKVPATPAGVLERADDYHKRGKEREAIALYTQFLDRYPGHDRADYAQYQLAESHFQAREYALAAVEYQILVSNYGYSEWVDDALFQMGVCNWREAPKYPRDQQKANEALSRFNQFLQIYPDSPRASEARIYVREIHARLAQKAYSAAKWYYRQREPKAALVYCEKIIREYPDNEYWAEALLLKGQILVDRGDTEGAIQQFTQVIAYPGDLPQKKEAERRIKEARP